MRVELIYSPGCSTYKKALDILETIIAEERLPIVVERTEERNHKQPLVKVDGHELNSGVPCGESFRSFLSDQWRALTIPAV